MKYIFCRVLKALTQKDYPDIRKLMFRHQYDDEKVEEFRGRCIRMNILVKLYMLNQLGPFAETNYRFSRKEFNQIWDEFYTSK
jgi:hypothetical protein